MIAIRRARPQDAAAIGAVHVSAWRSAYAGILPDTYLANLSSPRTAARYLKGIEAGGGIFVATISGQDAGPPGTPPRIVGFTTASPVTTPNPIADGEIETIYVLDDFRDRGLGRKLMRGAAAYLVAAGCTSAFVWVLRDNPSRWFYQRLGGRPTMEQPIQFAGRDLIQTAYLWSPIETLTKAVTPQA